MFRADDRFLVEQACSGNREAFRALVERYQRHAYRVAYRFLRNHPDAEDITQEAFIRVYQNIKNFRHESKFSTYLYRTVVNLSLNLLRRKDRDTLSNETPDGLERQSNDLVENPTIENLDVRDHLQRAIKRLSPKQQAVLVLRHYEGMSTKEVSEILKCSEGTVKQQLHRAILKMQKFLHYMKD